MKSILVALSVGVMVSQGTSAQKPPDFSGTWVMDLPRSEAAAQAAPSGPSKVVIRQGREEIQIDTTTRDGFSPTTYKMGVGKPADVSPAPPTFRWEGSRLVTVLMTAINGQAVTVTEARSLDPTGAEMTVETTVVVQHGYAGTAGVEASKNYSTMKNVFVKER
jgi:hypothetical protein